MVKLWWTALAAALVLFVGEASGSATSRQDLSIRMDDGVSIAATLYLPDGAPPAAGWPAIVFLYLVQITERAQVAIDGAGGKAELLDQFVHAYLSPIGDREQKAQTTLE